MGAETDGADLHPAHSRVVLLGVDGDCDMGGGLVPVVTTRYIRACNISQLSVIKAMSELTLLVSNPLAGAGGAALLLQEVLELSGLSLTAGPVFHTLTMPVQSWYHLVV